MKNEIIYTEDCALIVSELTSPGKEGQVFLTKENIIHTVVGWNYGDRLIIGHRPFTDAAILEGVPLLPEFSQEDDVVELALRTYPFGNSERNALITGYNKAKETYKYTEEDLIKAIDMATTRRHEDTVLFFRSDEIIQSLQQPKRPKYFEMEVYSYDNPEYNTYPKTKLISKGQTELVGSYIY